MKKHTCILHSIGEGGRGAAESFIQAFLGGARDEAECSMKLHPTCALSHIKH